MRIAIIGAAGQLGTDLVPRLGSMALPVTHADCDITDAPSIARMLDALQPERVINLAAYNLVDQAEDDPHTAFAINALGVRELARACGKRVIPLLHVSTDYVFGLDAKQREPFTEESHPGPISAYGASKLAGEYFVRSECPRHFIVRTCGLYGHQGARGKGNFVETMLKLAATRPELKIVADQFCTPTATMDLADAIADLVLTTAFGTWHATNAGQTTWYDFALAIFRLANVSVKVTPIPATEFPTKARRPPFSVLNCDKLSQLRRKEIPNWQAALERYLAAR